MDREFSTPARSATLWVPLPRNSQFFCSSAKHALSKSFRFRILRTLPFSVACKSIPCHSYQNCRVLRPFPIKNLKSYFKFPIRALCSLFLLFERRVFHNSLADNRFHAPSRNSWDAPELFPRWTSLAALRSSPESQFSRQSPITSTV